MVGSIRQRYTFEIAPEPYPSEREVHVWTECEAEKRPMTKQVNYAVRDKLQAGGFKRQTFMMGCGKCQTCLAERARAKGNKWSRRLLYAILDRHELGKAVGFVTLTFAPENKAVSDDPPDEDICKRHVQNFLKRVERLQSLEFYVCIKEYGDEKGRIHYHLFVAFEEVGWSYAIAQKVRSKWDHGWTKSRAIDSEICAANYATTYGTKAMVPQRVLTTQYRWEGRTALSHYKALGGRTEGGSELWDVLEVGTEEVELDGVKSEGTELKLDRVSISMAKFTKIGEVATYDRCLTPYKSRGLKLLKGRLYPCLENDESGEARKSAGTLEALDQIPRQSRLLLVPAQSKDDFTCSHLWTYVLEKQSKALEVMWSLLVRGYTPVQVPDPSSMLAPILLRWKHYRASCARSLRSKRAQLMRRCQSNLARQ